MTSIRFLKRIASQFGNKPGLFLLGIFLLGIFALEAQEMTEKEKAGYAVGVMLVEKIKSSDIDLSFIEALREGGFFESVRQGFSDASKGEPKLSGEELQATLEALKTKLEAIQNQGKKSEKEEESQGVSENNVNYQHLLAQNYCTISWYYLLIKEYAQSEQSARKALDLDGTYTISKTNLAHSLLFQDRFSEAEAIYKELSQTVYQNNDTYTKALLNDFDELEKADAIPKECSEDVNKIRQMLCDRK